MRLLRFFSLSLRSARTMGPASPIAARANASASYSKRRERILSRGQTQKVIVPASNPNNNIAGTTVCRGPALIRETESVVKPWLTRQPGDCAEPDKDADDRKRERLRNVPPLVMANLMRQHRFHFRFSKLRDQRVEQDNFPKSSKPDEESVGVAGAFATVHDFDVSHGKIDALCQRNQPLAQRALGQRRELVE